MIFPAGAARRTSLEAASQKIYDAVIVGSGVSGSIIANELSRNGKTVLIVEAGPDEDRTLKGYDDFLSLFYATAEKDNQSPYPRNPNAPMPRGSDVRQIPPDIYIGLPGSAGPPRERLDLYPGLWWHDNALGGQSLAHAA